MIAYHVDRNKDLHIGQILKLQQNPVIHMLENSSLNHLNEVSCFGSGVLKKGRIVPATTEDAKIEITETFLEFLRKELFRDKPSRLQSVFALKHLSDLKLWSQFLKNEYYVWEIEFNHNHYHYGDASLFTFGEKLEKENAFWYWGGKFNNPALPELVIELPVKINRLISQHELQPYL